MDELKKEDYMETCCPFAKPGKTQKIPIGRVFEKLDEYFNSKEYEMAQRHLDYWLVEASQFNDCEGMLAVLNEQIGLYRKLLKKEECEKACNEAIEIANSLELEGTVSLGTTFINVATAYKAFNRPEDALPLFEKAKEIYESKLVPTDEKLASLYNNMAVTLIDLKKYEDAEESFNKALEIMSYKEQGEIEMAITYCNLADLVSASIGDEEGEQKISEYLTKAEDALNKEYLTKDGYYAFVCEKCAPVFLNYGFFATGNELKQRAEEIYERA